MALTGYEKSSLEQYTKNELVEIAKEYTLYYQTDSGQGSTGNYEKLTKEKLISIIKSDRDYQSAAPTEKLSRVQRMMKRISIGFDTPVEIMAVIQEIFDDVEKYPRPGNIYTFVYTAKTPGIRYDQHPLVIVKADGFGLSGFKGYNVHWSDHRNYVWEGVESSFHRVQKGEEFDYLHDVPYAEILQT